MSADLLVAYKAAYYSAVHKPDEATPAPVDDGEEPDSSLQLATTVGDDSSPIPGDTSKQPASLQGHKLADELLCPPELSLLPDETERSFSSWLQSVSWTLLDPCSPLAAYATKKALGHGVVHGCTTADVAVAELGRATASGHRSPITAFAGGFLSLNVCRNLSLICGMK